MYRQKGYRRKAIGKTKGDNEVPYLQEKVPTRQQHVLSAKTSHLLHDVRQGERDAVAVLPGAVTVLLDPRTAVRVHRLHDPLSRKPIATVPPNTHDDDNKQQRQQKSRRQRQRRNTQTTGDSINREEEETGRNDG